MKNIFLFLCVSLVMTACGSDAGKKVKTVELKFTKQGELTLKKSDGSLIKKLDVEFAETPYERETGLMYRTSMEKEQSMLFIFDTEFPRSFYMKNTNIPLDIIYIDANKEIVSFQKNATPLSEESLPSEYPAKYVLEINGGMADAWSLKVGDKISFEKY